MEGSSIQAAPHDIENPNPYMHLETSMMEELDCLSPMSDSRCIYRVPYSARCVCEEAYTPRVISIGPLHHGKEAMKTTEEHKKRYLRYFLGRTNNLGLKDYIKIIKDREARLRSCYSETIELESDEFVRIILLDAIFVIEFLFRYWYPEVLDEDDCIFGKPLMTIDIRSHLLMLENQLPFFILVDLFDPHIFPVHSKYTDALNGVERLSILFLSRYFLDSFCSIFEGKLDSLETIYSSEVEVQHLVDLLRKLSIGSRLKKEQSAGQSKSTIAPSIEELHLAGLKFKEGSTKNLFEIRFKEGVLEIPKLKIEDFTELVLRNLVAFEQCSDTYQENYVSDYVSIMDKFVDTQKDVELLVENRIVENHLGGGNNELSTMINSLSTGVTYDSRNFYYSKLCEDLNKFCGSKWHKSKANLRQNYFNTPWAIISFFAAVLLLILTVVQTICSIISLP